MMQLTEDTKVNKKKTVLVVMEKASWHGSVIQNRKLLTYGTGEEKSLVKHKEKKTLTMVITQF